MLASLSTPNHTHTHTRGQSGDMRRLLMMLALGLGLAAPSRADELTALAHVDAGPSRIEDSMWGRTTLTVHLSQGIPFRVFLLEDPARLVIDFGEADWTGVRAADLLSEPGRIADLRFGAFQPGWSRLVADLSRSMLPEQIAMPVDPDTGRAVLKVTLRSATDQEFAARAGVPKDPNWTRALVDPAPKAAEPDRFTVMLDPGHGGVDPGAQSDGLTEKDLMLSFARSLAEALRRGGIDVAMTRDEDVFVALETRVALAHQSGADLLLSLHADSLTEGGAQGATVYVLSDEASDAASEHLAARHNRSDIIAGADLTGSDDQVTSILLDLARVETEPRSAALAEALVAEIFAAGGPMNGTPLRHAGFSVLKSADIPSVLIELGFMSSERDLKNLRDPVWRAGMVDAISSAVKRWRDEDAARKPFVRR